MLSALNNVYKGCKITEPFIRSMYVCRNITTTQIGIQG